MATVIGVRFKKAGKVYYFDPNEIWPRPGDYVVVETARGMEFGEVVTSARSVSDEQVKSPLKKVVRLATEDDIHRAAYNEHREKEAMRVCQEKIAKHKLEMKLVSVEYTFDNSKLIFYFTANGRVDFRELVKDLAGVFKMRIELRQIGVRDEAKMLGGLGSCGRPICCGAFLGDFQPVSIKMAKEQNLSLNPTKISGLCGRLMCCLKYEQDAYEAVLKRLPKVGKDIVTPDGVGVIAEINAIRERVKVRIRTADDSFDVREYSVDEVRRPGADDPAAIREPRKPQDRRGARRGAAQPEEEAEEPKKKRYPHQKAPKNLSTDQFLEKMREREDAQAAEEPTQAAPEKEPHKRRRRGRGRGQDDAGENRSDAPRERAGKNRPSDEGRPTGEAAPDAPRERAGKNRPSDEGRPADEVAPDAPRERGGKGRPSDEGRPAEGAASDAPRERAGKGRPSDEGRPTEAAASDAPRERAGKGRSADEGRPTEEAAPDVPRRAPDSAGEAGNPPAAGEKSAREPAAQDSPKASFASVPSSEPDDSARRGAEEN